MRCRRFGRWENGVVTAEDEWEPSEREWDEANKHAVVQHLVGCYNRAREEAAQGDEAGKAAAPLTELLDGPLAVFTRRFTELVEVDTEMSDEFGVYSSKEEAACGLV